MNPTTSSEEPYGEDMFETWQVGVVQQEAEAMHGLGDLLDQFVDCLLVSPLDELVQRHQLLRVLRDAPHRLFDVLILLADPRCLGLRRNRLKMPEKIMSSPPAPELLPSVQLPVLLHLEDDDRVPQLLGAVAQVLVQLAGAQAEHGERHGDADGGDLPPQVVDALDSLQERDASEGSGAMKVGEDTGGKKLQ